MFTFKWIALCWQIVGNQFDTIQNEEASEYFETIYALLDTVSPGYRLSFSQALTEKLLQLQNPTVQ